MASIAQDIVSDNRSQILLAGLANLVPKLAEVKL